MTYAYSYRRTRKIYVCPLRKTERRNGCVAKGRGSRKQRERERERERPGGAAEGKIDSIVKSKLQGNEQLAAGS